MKSARFKLPVKADLADVVGAAVTTALTLIFIFGLLAPIALRGRLAAAQVEAAAREQQRATAIKSSIRTAKEELDRLRDRLAAAPMQIQPVTALNERLAMIISLASDCRLVMQDVRPGEAVRAKRFASVPVRLAGQGRYPDVAAFLQKLHARMPDVAVSNMKLIGTPDDPAAASLCELELRWTAMPNDSALPAAQLASTPGD